MNQVRNLWKNSSHQIKIISFLNLVKQKIRLSQLLSILKKVIIEVTKTVFKVLKNHFTTKIIKFKNQKTLVGQVKEKMSKSKVKYRKSLNK